MNEFEYVVEEEDASCRVDKYCALQEDTLSRAFIQRLLKEGKILVNGSIVKANYNVKTGDFIQLFIEDNVDPEILPEDIPLDILYEDEDILIVNKPKDMVVHPAAGHTSGTLVNAVMFHCKDSLSGINGVNRPGIVHRIDKDTTGSLIICKNDIAHNSIAEQLKVHSITRKYIAIVHGDLKDEEGTIDKPIGRDKNDRKKMAVNQNRAKNAVTHYKVLKHYKEYTYIECVLETGRTHQIRVHMASIGHPILGDEIYGGNRKSKFATYGQALHAKTIGFIHPRTGEYMEFEAPIPEYFTSILDKLNSI